jgi:hypothetical protein
MFLPIVVCIAFTCGLVHAVVPIPVGELLYAPAHAFDLSQRNVKVCPLPGASYRWTWERAGSRQDLPDGRKESATPPFGAVSGLPAIDLYAMGLAAADEVPELKYVDAASGEFRSARNPQS